MISLKKKVHDSFPFLGHAKYNMPPCEQYCFFLLANKMCKTLIGKLDFGYIVNVIQTNYIYTQTCSSQIY
jgi:hypothetical protein